MRPAGRRPVWDGHLLLLYHDESQRRTEVAARVPRGLGLGAKILYTEPDDESPGRSLSGLLQSEPGAVAAMASDQIQVVTADCTGYDPAWQASVVEQALCQGYPCVRRSRDAARNVPVPGPRVDGGLSERQRGTRGRAEGATAPGRKRERDVRTGPERTRLRRSRRDPDVDGRDRPLPKARRPCPDAGPSAHVDRLIRILGVDREQGFLTEAHV